jgi:hypothetical protein
VELSCIPPQRPDTPLAKVNRQLETDSSGWSGAPGEPAGATGPPPMVPGLGLPLAGAGWAAAGWAAAGAGGGCCISAWMGFE